MLKPLYLLVELLLVVDGIPLSFDSKADVIAFVYIGRCYDQCVAGLFLINVGWSYNINTNINDAITSALKHNLQN